MNRLFDEHRVRKTFSLDGLWQFQANGVGVSTNWQQGTQVWVPGAWETLPGLETHRGFGRYERSFRMQQAGHVRLVFGGVSHTGTVFVDGNPVGKHEDAFTPWEVIVSDIDAGEHQLTVDVDNSFGDHTALHIENDYYTYGGITRPVEMHVIPDIFIERLYAHPYQDSSSWFLDVSVVLRNIGKTRGIRSVLADIQGKTVDLGTIEIAQGASATVSNSFMVSDILPWSAEQPALYYLTVQLVDLSEVVDDLIERIGFREVVVQGKRLLLNGQTFRLRGYNRHEDHALYGNALPVEAMIQDLQILTDMDCNFIRTSHYPNDQRFLDLCDELGFYVWEESHARHVDFNHPRFDIQIEDSTREMLEWHYNHPSIIVWGCLNECDSVSEHGQQVYARVLRQIKSFDPYRPTTYASCERKKDQCQKFADILSLNIYTGGLVGTIAEIEPVINDLLHWIHSDASGGGMGKPVVLSEFGAEALYGNHSRLHNHWTEEYQAEVLDECLRVYLNLEDIIGVAVWQLCDCRVTEGFFKGRPRTYNNKGTLDEFRRPKLAYDIVKRRMNEARTRWETK